MRSCDVLLVLVAAGLSQGCSHNHCVRTEVRRVGLGFPETRCRQTYPYLGAMKCETIPQRQEDRPVCVEWECDVGYHKNSKGDCVEGSAPEVREPIVASEVRQSVVAPKCPESSEAPKREDELLPTGHASTGPSSGALVGGWRWGGFTSVFRADGTGTYYDGGRVCYEFRYVMQDGQYTKTADRDSTCAKCRTNSYRYRIEDGELVIKHVGSGFQSRWRPAAPP
jgi:hypothetical protein